MLGGAIVVRVGEAWAYVLDAAPFLPGTLFVAKFCQGVAKPTPSARRRIRDGMTSMRRSQGLRAAFIATAAKWLHRRVSWSRVSRWTFIVAGLGFSLLGLLHGTHTSTSLVLAAYSMVATIVAPIGGLAIGGLADALSPTSAVLLSGIALLLAGAIGRATWLFRALDELDHPHAPAAAAAVPRQPLNGVHHGVEPIAAET